MLKLPRYDIMAIMPFQKGNKLHLKVKRKSGREHPRFGCYHSEESKKKMSISKTGWKMPEEQRIRLSESKKGEKSPFWKGGVTSINKIIRNSVEYKLWREKVFIRDKYTCVFCGKKGGDLNADHIKPFAYFPESRLEIENGRTLCVPCHRTTFSYSRKIC
jgi:hypothetical protein